MGDRGAILEGPYRYRLWRYWDRTRRPALFVMLNPSTADAVTDDPTIRRCRAFAGAWGYGGLEVVNLFALRSPDPVILSRIAGAEGLDNDRHIVEAAWRAGIIVAAWGATGARFAVRAAAVADLLEAAWSGPVFCLGLTKAGGPRHPLYVAARTEPMRFR